MQYTYKSKFPTDTGIYKIYFSHNINKVYIGSALSHKPRYPADKGFNRRWKKHLRELKNNKHSNPKLQNSFNKYGISSLNFEIVELCDPNNGITREQHWIDFYKSSINGLNCKHKADSNLGRVFGESTRKKISENSVKKGIESYNNALLHENEIVKLYKEHNTFSTISKILKIPKYIIPKIVKKNNVERSQKNCFKGNIIYCYDFNGDLKFKKKNFKEMSLLTSVPETSIRSNVLNCIFTTHNLIFSYIELNPQEINKRQLLFKKKKSYYKIIQYNSSKKLVKIWDSTKKVKEYCNAKSLSWLKICIEDKRLYKNSFWEYKID